LIFQIRGDEFIRVDGGGISGQSELRRSPVAKHLVAPRHRLEPQLFVVDEFGFKSLRVCRRSSWLHLIASLTD
jgi:ribosomal protein S9